MAPGWRLAPARSAASPSPWLSTHRPKPPAQEPARRATRPYLGLEVLDLDWWLSQPLRKMMEFVSWDDDIPKIWKKIKHVPNHPPTSFLPTKTWMWCLWCCFFLTVLGCWGVLGLLFFYWLWLAGIGSWSDGLGILRWVSMGINEDGTTG